MQKRRHYYMTPFLFNKIYGGANRGRTGDLMHAMHALFQLSYSPVKYNNNGLTY